MVHGKNVHGKKVHGKMVHHVLDNAVKRSTVKRSTHFWSICGKKVHIGKMVHGKKVHGKMVHHTSLGTVLCYVGIGFELSKIAILFLNRCYKHSFNFNYFCLPFYEI